MLRMLLHTQQCCCALLHMLRARCWLQQLRTKLSTKFSTKLLLKIRS